MSKLPSEYWTVLFLCDDNIRRQDENLWPSLYDAIEVALQFDDALITHTTTDETGEIETARIVTEDAARLLVKNALADDQPNRQFPEWVTVLGDWHDASAEYLQLAEEDAAHYRAERMAS